MLKSDEKYIYGVPEIDTEHSELIQHVEDLMNAYQNNNPESEILLLFDFLKKYVEKHFSHEEEIQRKVHYPDFENHKQIHDDFKNQINALYEQVQSIGLTVQNRITFNHLCSEWIYHHIGEEDKKLADFILKNR